VCVCVKDDGVSEVQTTPGGLVELRRERVDGGSDKRPRITYSSLSSDAGSLTVDQPNRSEMYTTDTKRGRSRTGSFETHVGGGGTGGFRGINCPRAPAEGGHRARRGTAIFLVGLVL